MDKKLSLIEKFKMFRKYQFLLNYSLFKPFYKNKFFSLTFHITTRCNAHCLMCFNWQTMNKNLKDLSLEEINKFTKNIGNLPNLSLSGGEPFLRDDIVEICKIFKKNCQTNKIAIPTNGLLPELIIKKTEEILKTCPVRLKLCLSLDGTGQVHDEIRRVDGAFEKFKKTLQAAIALTKKYPKLQVNINTTAFTANQNNLEELVSFINNIPEIKFHNIEFIRGAFNNHEAETITPEKYDELIDKIILKSKSLNNDKYHKKIYALYHNLAVKILKTKKQLVRCRAASHIPVIDALGNVYHCEILPPIANLKDYNYDFKKIWNSETAKKQRQNIAAKKCYCTHLCYQIQNIPMSPYYLIKAIFAK